MVGETSRVFSSSIASTRNFPKPERLIRKFLTPDDTLLGMDKAEHRWFPLYESSQGKEYQVKHSIL